MNYREKMREYLKEPDVFSSQYGKWCALNKEQREYIRKLLDEMDRADEYIKTLYFKNENLQSKIDKAIEILNKLCIYGYGQVNCRPIKNTTKQEVYNAMYEIKNILKEAENVENN